MVEPLSVPVPGNIQVANTLVNASKTCFHIQEVNPTSKMFGSSHGHALVQYIVQLQLVGISYNSMSSLTR